MEAGYLHRSSPTVPDVYAVGRWLERAGKQVVAAEVDQGGKYVRPYTRLSKLVFRHWATTIFMISTVPTDD